MAAQVEIDRWQEIRTLWQQNQWLYILAGVLIGVLLSPALQAISADAGQFLRELAPEAVGIIFTVVFIDRLYQRREEEKRIKDLKAQLVREVGSQSNEAAKRAISELRAHGWLYGDDSLLQKKYLTDANLEGAALWNANLQGVILRNANLHGARLESANLKGSELISANLQAANLGFANLQRANLMIANLQDADLTAANLQEADLRISNLQRANLLAANLYGADLTAADLQGANLMAAELQKTNLGSATFDETTMLPDETLWTPTVDLSRFTDPNHPEFWRAYYEGSPAYQGKYDPQAPAKTDNP